jgi:hypothetical protein
VVTLEFGGRATGEPEAIMVGDALPFDHLMQACSDIETRVNNAAMQ